MFENVEANFRKAKFTEAVADKPVHSAYTASVNLPDALFPSPRSTLTRCRQHSHRPMHHRNQLFGQMRMVSLRVGQAIGIFYDVRTSHASSAVYKGLVRPI